VRFDRVRLRNFKCYDDAELALQTGVTVIHGVNGSGKSSLLEACFFALYGASALDGPREEVITTGEDECEVECWFRHAGSEYHVERTLKDYGDRVSHDVVLEAPDGTYEGARDVEAAVRELLRMDADAFVNCAYVRQGEVNKLIHASPGDRQDMIDDLLQLGKLEEYRERAADARLGVKTVLDGKRERLEGLTEQVEAKEDEDLHATLNELETDLAEVAGEIERYEENRANAEETLQHARDVIERHEEKREELASVREDIAELQDAIAETESERGNLRDRVREARDRAEALEGERDDLLVDADLPDGADREGVDDAIDACRDDLEDVREERQEHVLAKQERDSEADALAEAAEDLAERAAEKRAEADDLADEVAETEAKLEESRERLGELDDRTAAEREKFADAPVDFGEADGHLESLADEREARREELQDVQASLRSARERVAEAERLLEEGKCPECGQPVEGSPHVDGVDEDRERVADLESEVEAIESDLEHLDDRVERAEALVEAEGEVAAIAETRDTVETIVADREDTLASHRERVETLRADADELDAEAEAKREAAAEEREAAEAVREDIADCNRREQSLKGDLETLAALADAWDDLADVQDEVERLRERRSDLADQNEERREYLASLRERRDDLEADFDEDRIAEARDDEERAEQYLEQVDAKLDDLEDREADLRDRIGGVRAEIDSLQELREQRDALADRVTDLESLYDEAQQLQTMYGDLRAELRQTNVETLERMLNETFDLVYQNDSYAHIELDGEYALTVYQKDGETLDPEQLSGGERALFNLSLRCAIYRLLSEGIEGSAPMPPLILDEPTVFLDSGHVSKLLDLVAFMRDEVGVAQIVVVSHDEELVGAADDLVRVEKNPTTNRSSVRRQATAVDAPTT
jgi:exonuclease SbcC